MNVPLAPEQLESLRRLDGCTLANAIETFHKRRRNESYTNQSIKCLFPKLSPIVGYAATVKICGSVLPTADEVCPDRTDWWDYILSLPAPRIVVVQDVAMKIGLCSFLGAIHANILHALGCVGALTNGSAHDLPDVERSAFQMYAGGVCISHSYVHIDQMGTPVEIGGLTIRSGDLLHGDLHGVQTIPMDVADKIEPVAAQIARKEKTLIELCQSKEFSLQKLREVLAHNHS
jgi:4-hydroxy-4-methyl-2-oxoglutarate aldolase